MFFSSNKFRPKHKPCKSYDIARINIKKSFLQLKSTDQNKIGYILKNQANCCT